MKIINFVRILVLVCLTGPYGCRNVMDAEKELAPIKQAEDTRSGAEFDPEHPFGEEDQVGRALVKKLKNVHPNIWIGKMERIVDLRDGDVISAIVCAVPEESGIFISYRGANRSWIDRQSIPNDTFVEFLKKKPDLYSCLAYVFETCGIYVYYLEGRNEVRIFMLDYPNGETEKMLPEGVRRLPMAQWDQSLK